MVHMEGIHAQSAMPVGPKQTTLPAKTPKTSLFLEQSIVLTSPVLDPELLLLIRTLHLTHGSQLLPTRDPDVFLRSTDFTFP